MTPPPKAGLSRNVWIAIAAVIIIVVIIAALVLSGVFNPQGTPGPTESKYNVTFTESGLSSGTSWSVTLGGSTLSSTTSSIVFSEKNGTYSFTIGAVSGYTASPASGSVVVSGAAVTKAITFTSSAAATYAVTFTESGLASGTSWTVTLDGTPQSSTTTSIAFTKANGTYAYSIGSVTGYTASPASGTVTVSGAAKSVAITFTAIPPGQYTVTFTESGLPSGTSWSVTLAGTTQSSTTTTIAFTKANGTYSYTVGAVTGYTASPGSGSVTVAGSAQSVSIAFTSSGLSGPTYKITWTQTGLPSTDLWSVGCLINATGSYIFGAQNTGVSTEFTVPDGTYFWYADTSTPGYVPSPGYGTTTVAGADVTISIHFLRTYTVNFTESGLSASTLWNVTLGGNYSSSFAPDNVTIDVTNGTYSFTVQAFGYTASPATGTVTVNGADVSKAITFTAQYVYTVTFTESGLPGGTFWGVYLNGTFNYTTAPYDNVFQSPAGKQEFSALSIGYDANPASGNVTVTTSGATVHITFAAPPAMYSVTFTETGLGATDWEVTMMSNHFVASLYYYCDNSTTTSNTLVCMMPNGYYTWVAMTSLTGYTASPMSGGIHVNGAGLSVSVTFVSSATKYLVWFNALYYTFLGGGLPNGTSWSVTVNGNTQTTTGFLVGFLVNDGTTAAYTIAAPTGYVVLPSAGNLTGYASPTQSVDYETVSPGVILAFASSSPGIHSGPLVGMSATARFVGSLAVTSRRL